ncbi:Conserved_hypothetical protein [Hexamita inflata]|uniref:Uncharacterized protein n=1 Tax=Hexamita inflata TaxID=28002 RepID=A0ABP1LJP5_9EUKA
MIKCDKDLITNTVLLGIYIASGFLAPIVLEYIKHQGAAEGKGLLFAMPNSIAMAFVLCVPQKTSKITFMKKYWWQVFLMSFIDVIGTTMTLVGQIMCGSGVYIIIYSSLTVWSALGSRISMKKHFNILQILGIVIVTAGLGVSGISSFDAGQQVIIGIVITLVGTIFHSCVYWLNEFFNHKYGVHMQIMCGYTGVFGLCLYMIYQCAYTIPHWQEIVIDPIKAKGGVYWQIGLLYGALIVVDLMHMFAQYTVVPRVGSVSTGVGKSISSIIVFVLSHVLFCSQQASQCIDVWKIVSLCVVLAGVMTYSVGVVMRKKKSDGENKKLLEYTDAESQSFTYDQRQRDASSEDELLLDDEKQEYK